MFARDLFGGIAATTLAVSSAAFAQAPVVVEGQPADVPTEHVRYADLDLATESGARKLEGRVVGAIRRVCNANGNYGGTLAQVHRACRINARAQARPQLAQAIVRAGEFASAGTTSIAAAAIVISAN